VIRFMPRMCWRRSAGGPTWRGLGWKKPRWHTAAAVFRWTRPLAAHLLGREAPSFPRPEQVTAVIFTAPELMTAGLSESGAREAGFEVGVARYDFSQDARAQIGGYDNGLLKIFYDCSTLRVLGVQALVANAASLAGEAALLIRSGTTLGAVAEGIHPHPTLSESFVSAARGDGHGESLSGDSLSHGFFRAWRRGGEAGR